MHFANECTSLLVKNYKFSLMTPMNLSYWWNMGSLLGILMLIQIFSGFLLSFYYENSEVAFYSIWMIHLDIFYGGLLHYMHLNFASFIFFFIYIHLMKGLLFNSYINLKFVWITGWIILFLLMMIAFLGYVLPWGQMSLWGATVITNLISVAPFGNELVKWIWSGYFVSVFTMKLFFSLHFILPMMLMIMIMIHIVMLHFLGSSNPVGGFNNSMKMEFMPVFLLKDLLNIIIIIMLMVNLLLNPYMLGDPENFIHSNSLVSPIHIQPEWYFLQYYAVLRAIPSKLGGVILFMLSLVFIMMLIYINQQSSNYFKLFILMNFIFVNINLMLMWLGGCPVENPYLITSQGFSILYFLWFFLIFIINYSF